MKQNQSPESSRKRAAVPRALLRLLEELDPAAVGRQDAVPARSGSIG
ncbi:hypothetical protein GCM10010279_62310 [Streptomyces mutabilis]|nr:hypothetical protein GCM10010279_62310 [Streptomyces mutabilis]